MNESPNKLRFLTSKNAFPGLVLVAIGLLVLLSGTPFLRVIGGIVGVVIFSLLAAYAYVEGQRTGSRWWQLATIPLLALAVASIFPGALAALFMLALAAVFFIIWMRDQTKWWALIPAAICGFQGLVQIFRLSATAPLFYVVAGVVALVISRTLPAAPRWLTLAGIVAIVFGAASYLFGATYAAPLIFIGFGVYLLLQNVKRS